jgi:hypothetical protein
MKWSKPRQPLLPGARESEPLFLLGEGKAFVQGVPYHLLKQIPDRLLTQTDNLTSHRRLPKMFPNEASLLTELPWTLISKSSNLDLG